MAKPLTSNLCSEKVFSVQNEMHDGTFGSYLGVNKTMAKFESYSVSFIFART